MSNDDTEYFKALMETVLGWRLSHAKGMVLLYIATRIYSAKKCKIRITTEDFLHETHYSRQPIVDAVRYLLDRSIITREIDKSDNKSYLYSVIIYDMQDGEKTEGVMATYNKNGNGYSSWGKSFSKTTDKDRKAYRTHYLGVDVEEWNYNDFAFFLEDFTNHCAKNIWNVDISDVDFIMHSCFRRNQTFVNIVDYLENHSGQNFCKLMLKAYIQWCTEELFRKVVKEQIKPIKGRKQFSLGHYCHKPYMQDFLDGHGITENMKSVASVEVQLADYRRIVEKKTTKIKPVHSLKPADMKEYYKGGISTLLSECGVVLSGNYLMEYEGKTFQEAAEEIGSFLKGLNVSHDRQKKTLQIIFDKTCIGSPYHNTMKFLNWHKIYRGIFEQLGKKFDLSGFGITKSKKRNSYTFFTEKEKVEV